METMAGKKAGHRRSFSEEFEAELVDLVRTSGKTVTEVCRALDLTETAMRGCLRQAEIHGVSGAG
ncbi:MAG TPA: transposase [Acidimicrobiales bacterium]|jgi:transposase|nr:transposase [Acidimicrobiales bacterium]